LITPCNKSILKSGPDVCLFGLDLHILHQFEHLFFLFLLQSILGPKTEEQRVKDQRSNDCQCVYQNFLLPDAFLTVKLFDSLAPGFHVFMVDVPLPDLVIQQIFERF
jgi:hypothetical protein